MRPTTVYLLEIKLRAEQRARRFLRGGPREYEGSPQDAMRRYESRRSTFAERVSDMTLDEFVVGEVDSLVQQHPTLSGYLDGKVTQNIEPVRRRMMDRMLATVSRYEPSTVLEVGAGTGRNLIWLASQMPGCRFIGYELTPSGVEAGKIAAARFGLDVDMVQADITSAELPAADVVISVHALEQIAPLADARAVVDRMQTSARRAVVMYEPFPDLWPRGLAALAHRLRAEHFDRLKAGTLSGRPLTSAELLPFGFTVNRVSEVVIEN